MRSLGRADVLVLDDWGLAPLDAGARHDLLELLEERYGRRSIIITSQLIRVVVRYKGGYCTAALGANDFIAAGIGV